MIVHRFMSDLEYQRLMAGDTLKNNKKHSEAGKKSTSVGFCFFTEPPQEAVHWLSFAVGSLAWCVTFDIPDNLLHKSQARYRDPQNDSLLFPSSIVRIEWCLKKYSLKTVRVVHADNQWATYEENLKKQVLKEFGPLGQVLLMMI